MHRYRIRAEEECEMEATPAFRPGLEDVVVAESALSLVDGEGGRLIVRGFAIEDLASLRFEEVCGLLWSGSLPSAGESEALRRGLGAGRAVAFKGLHRVLPLLDAADAMD